MKYKDYYKIMGLKRDATQDEIKRAHRRLARKYHPDVSKEPDAEARFKEAGEAYEVLKDPEKRAAYDRLDPSLKQGQEFHPPPNWDSGFEFSGGGFTGAGGGGFSDFFEELFGHPPGAAEGRQGSPFANQPQDHHARVRVDLEDAFQGATRTITLQSPELNAKGELRLTQRTLNVKIPKGIKEGQQIRLKGQGGTGDLYLETHFNPHPLYRTEGRDLHMQLPVAPWEAALGATVHLPTPGGAVDLKVPPNANSGNQLRLKGRGIPGTPPGDIYVTLMVVVPPANSEEERALYREMEKRMAFNPRDRMGR